MKADGIWFRGHTCFKDDWAGFEIIKPINIVVGRNNSGKSRLLDLVERAIGGDIQRQQVRFTGELTEAALRTRFSGDTDGGDLGGNHWRQNGIHFIGRRATWTSIGGKVDLIDIGPSATDWQQQPGRRARLVEVVAKAARPLAGKRLRRIGAERDISPEPAENSTSAGVLGIDPNGEGATNVVRRYITGTTFPRDLVQKTLLDELNAILGDNGRFTEIQVRQHVPNTNEPDHWEIFLGERSKGLVSLSSSGSGLKTLILVLLNLIVVPHLAGAPDPGSFVFCFEELENSLHPALFRRLLAHLESYAVEKGATFFLTTHSPVALDVFAGSPNAQVLRVQHDGTSAKVTMVSHEFERHGAITDLGAKASDLLQANGIVWVEGPSDAIYLNRWIELLSGSSLREGRDYQCAYFGGSLLAQMQARPADDAEENLMNLLRLNANVVLIADSDRTSAKDSLKPRVERIKAQLEAIPHSKLWITEAREIENYLPGDTLTSLVERQQPLRSPNQFESFWPKKRSTSSFWTKVVGRVAVDKVELARTCAAGMTLDNMRDRFDWFPRMSEIVEAIRGWNS